MIYDEVFHGGEDSTSDKCPGYFVLSKFCFCMIVLYICKNVYVMNTKATIEVDLSLFEQLKRYAKSKGRTITEVVEKELSVKNFTFWMKFLLFFVPLLK